MLLQTVGGYPYYAIGHLRRKLIGIIKMAERCAGAPKYATV